MTLAIRISRIAFRHIDAADSWWRDNRPISPDLFSMELQSTLSRIQEHPTVFATVADPRFPGLRRLLLPRTRYHLYWTTSSDSIEVLAVWHTSRGGSPFDAT